MGITDWLLKPLGWLFARHPDWRDAFGRLIGRVSRQVAVNVFDLDLDG